MVDNQKARQLHEQLVQSMRQSGVFQAPGVEAAFRAIPRHIFLPNHPLEEVYSDKAVGILHDETGLLVSSSSQPSMMAIMMNQLQLKPGDNVLEIGTATGYNAALMSYIVGEKGRVTTVELEKNLAEQARRNLASSKSSGVTVVHGDGSIGYAPRAEYDHIVATVGVWDVPAAWLRQLKPEGSLVVPIVIDGVQVSATFKRQSDGTFVSKDNRPCSFVYLRGAFAGPDFRRQVGSASLYILADQVEQIDTAALHLLLSDDQEICLLDTPIEQTDFWFGYQLYVMLNEPKDFIFAVYAVIEGQSAYGLDGRGIALFSPGSAAFASYDGGGQVHCFAGSDAMLELQRLLDEWLELRQPKMNAMRLRLLPKGVQTPIVASGKFYERRDHVLQVWMEVPKSS
ncbi:MAG: hypothetical protein KC496_08390 [Anaerolineae bacterium]|nr:hypothetical protein [Anaerolineae bacterium]